MIIGMMRKMTICALLYSGAPRGGGCILVTMIMQCFIRNENSRGFDDEDKVDDDDEED